MGLDNGFELAKVKMNHVIRQDIRYDIGGDRQQISTMQTQYSDTSYKNVLFPLWTAQFKWKNKIYNYAINGQTGKVSGERPYSWLKIAAIVGTLGGGAGGAVYVDQHPEVLNFFSQNLIDDKSKKERNPYGEVDWNTLSNDKYHN